MDFIIENAWSFVALLPALIVVVGILASKGTKIDCPTSLKAHLLDANEEQSWNLRN